MAEFYVRNSLNYNKAVKFNITLRNIIIKGEKGESLWTLEIGTTHKDKDRNDIKDIKIHDISSDNLDDVIEDVIANLSSKINWSPLVKDKEAPYIFKFLPSGDNVPIEDNVEIIIKDSLPSAGMDLSNLKITLNNGTTDFDITSQTDISGDPYEYIFRWKPRLKVYNTYD